jgi:hypothetical protein
MVPLALGLRRSRLAVSSGLGLYNAQQRAGGVAQHCRPLGVAQARRLENVIYSRARPRIRIISPHHNLASAAFRHQMPQRFGGEDQRVEIELPQVLSGTFLQRCLAAALRKGQTAVIRPSTVDGR